VATKQRPENRYELLTCAFKGHRVVGSDVGEITSEDQLLAREAEGIRWLRCLRCDGWYRYPIPEHPERQSMPLREEIEVPARGPELREKYVLRLIALDRAVHVIVLVALAVALFTFARHHNVLERDYNDIMNDLSGGDPGTSSVRGILGRFRSAVHYSPRQLTELGLAVTAYAALEATEMVGLWLGKRWAEYLTFVATTVLVPFEIYELTNGVSILKVLTLVINVAIVVYLLLSKRLFGLRGGYRYKEEERRRMSGWGAIERGTPEAALAP
jgi:uncharacterized membrane protein (DUF2068 family)